MVHGDFYAVDRGQNRSAHFFQRLPEILDLSQSLGEQLVKLFAEGRVVGRNCSQHPGMIKRSVQQLLQFSHAPNNAGIH